MRMWSAKVGVCVIGPRSTIRRDVSMELVGFDLTALFIGFPEPRSGIQSSFQRNRVRAIRRRAWHLPRKKVPARSGHGHLAVHAGDSRSAVNLAVVREASRARKRV